tara:strand:- start:162 stop:1274 length:1113 start_codon:yes stop_codon:yes gene_type:complete
MNSEKLVNIHWIGRLGNRMFQYAFGCSYAYKNNVIYYIPSEWEGSLLFKPFPYARTIPEGYLKDCILENHREDEKSNRIKCVTEDSDKDLVYKELQHFTKHDLTNAAFDDLDMMYYSVHFQLMCTDFLKKSVFVFSDLVKGTEMYQDLESRKGTYVVAHVRRGDIVNSNYNNGHHVAVTLSSYKRLLDSLKIKNEDVIWLCEDSSIATKHKWYHEGGNMGWDYPIGQKYLNDNIIFDFLPDFLTIYFAKTVLRGNSGFSWWAAELSNSNVYSPVVPKRPDKHVGPFWVDCEFVNNNTPHFMGSNWDPILLRKECTLDEKKFINNMKINKIPDNINYPTRTLRRKRPRRWWILIFLLIIGVVLISGCCIYL